MKVELVKKEDNYVELVLTGEDHSVPNALCDIIMQDDDVEFASYVIDHPTVGEPKLMVRTKKKDPLKLISVAAKKLSKEASEIEKAFGKKKK